MHSPLIVLVVEDDATLRYLANRQLAKLGITCHLAEDGAVALKMINETSYDLILMDVQMPVMNGLEATVAIRNSESEHHQSKQEDKGVVPIIAMTANPNKKRCMDAGMSDFIFKPISLAQMKQVIDRWLPAA